MGLTSDSRRIVHGHSGTQNVHESERYRFQKQMSFMEEMSYLKCACKLNGKAFQDLAGKNIIITN